MATPALTLPPFYNEPNFGQRILARAIDTIVIIPIVVLVGVLAEGALRSILGVVAVSVYEIAMVTTRGQTVGKIVMGTRIADLESGLNPPMANAALRWLTAIAGGVVGGVLSLDWIGLAYPLFVFAPILLGPLHRGLHDRVSSTIVTSTSITVPAAA